jgi:caffeoyl-CoA O-methyltransferase
MGDSAGLLPLPSAMNMTPERWQRTTDYLQEVFGREDEQLATLMERAVAAGLPSIAISSEVGRLLSVLVSLAGAGTKGVAGGPAGRATTVIELGTLAGYSTIWMARALTMLPLGGRLITVELDDRHADFAQGEFERAGIAALVEIRRGAALDVLPMLRQELGEHSVDVAFLDAVKTEYSDYARMLKPMLRRGGLLLADNTLGAEYWIDDAPGTNAARDAIDAFNRGIAADRDFEAALVPIRQGLLIARRM